MIKETFFLSLSKTAKMFQLDFYEENKMRGLQNLEQFMYKENHLNDSNVPRISKFTEKKR